jgi:phage shock protein C
MDPSGKLYRSRTNRMLGGVCGGLADFTGLDATVIRVIFVILTVFGGAGLLVYLAMWIIVPTAPA